MRSLQKTFGVFVRALFKLILWLTILSPFALAAVAWFSLSEQPLVLQQVQLSHNDIARAQKILKQNDPRRLPTGSTRRLDINEKDLNLASNYLLQKLSRGSTQIRIQPGFIDATGTLRIPGLPIRPYLNLSLLLEDVDGNALIRRLRVGQLDIPPVVAQFMLTQALTHLHQTTEYQVASSAVKQLSMQRGKLQVVYQWDPELIQQARSSILSPLDKEAINAYYGELLRLQDQGIGIKGSLMELTRPMFALAVKRSGERDPIIENQALLSVLGSWAGKQGLAQLVPEATRQPGSFRLKLERRRDFGQHFLFSAALAARGDGEISNAIGLFKEISDSDGGSGFSFTDIAADRAGSRFGELATRSATTARRVQQRMAAGASETDIMPRARDLPEHMTASEFQQRFGGVGGTAYNKVIADIEKRIANCAMYRD